MTVIYVDGLDGLQTVFDGISQDWNDGRFMGVLDTIMVDMERSHEEYFNRQGTPVGEAWPALSPRTIKEKGHSRILYRTGRLMESLSKTTSDSIRDKYDEIKNHGISFGTSVEYAMFHQEGTKHMPQREHVGTNDDQLNKICDMVADRAVEILKEHYGG